MGVRFDMLLNGNLPLAHSMAVIDALVPYVHTVEGPNEVDITPVHYEGMTGQAAAIALQKALYAAVHADPLLNGPGRATGVLPFTVSLNHSYAPYGDLSAYADYGSVHAYGGGGVPPQWFLQAEIKGATLTPWPSGDRDRVRPEHDAGLR